MSREDFSAWFRTRDLMILAVNGYGAPLDPINDPHYTRYLTKVVKIFYRLPRPGVDNVIYLLGGYTNNPDLTEAAAMKLWFDHHHPGLGDHIFLLEEATDLRGNMEALAKVAADRFGKRPAVAYFCEASRRPVTLMMARHYLRPLGVYYLWVKGIVFDEKALRWQNRLMQFGPKLWLEWLALRVGGPFERLRRWLRQRHIDKHRRMLGSA